MLFEANVLCGAFDDEAVFCCDDADDAEGEMSGKMYSIQTDSADEVLSVHEPDAPAPFDLLAFLLPLIAPLRLTPPLLFLEFLWLDDDEDVTMFVDDDDEEEEEAALA